jgi:hypothetical protein
MTDWKAVKHKPGIFHDEAVIRQLREDPEFAAEYISAAATGLGRRIKSRQSNLLSWTTLLRASGTEHGGAGHPRPQPQSVAAWPWRPLFLGPFPL